jgi:hypothetical protein
MITMHADISEMKIKVALLEAAHIESTSKIVVLIDGFNTLNLNLATLISSINTAVKTTLVGITLITTLAGGFWGYNLFITNQINRMNTLTQTVEHGK